VSNNQLIYVKKLIKDFEEGTHQEQSGVVYTPKRIADLIVANIFQILLIEFLEKHNIKLDSKNFSFEGLNRILNQNSEIRNKLEEKIKQIKILDPACGSGRFLESIGDYLLKLYSLFDDYDSFQSKKSIIMNNLYGNEIDNSACYISKLTVLSWLYSGTKTKLPISSKKIKILDNDSIDEKLDEIGISFNIYNLDFLFEFDINETDKYDVIVGNPPYIDNKKIKDLNLKKKLYKRFHSAYKLFDLSIIFLEKSLEILRNNEESYLSFIIPNKFLSADYGVKIREILLNQTEIKEIDNVSSLNIFKTAATYPIIISLKKTALKRENEIIIKNFENFEDFIKAKPLKFEQLSQGMINKLPSKVIPISGDIKMIQYIYSNFKTISDTFPNAKIIYRPFGFLKWATHFGNITTTTTNNDDLIILGTGNLGKYHIKFKKPIKIAKQEFNVSYFQYNSNYNAIWQELSKEKILIREIAKELTCIYDPGNFCNITGLYIITIPSLNTDELFCFLSIMNSKIMNLVFTTLFSTLHMSAGYLRFNGSFLKRLPMPKEFPKSLSCLGKINTFLFQLKYDFPFLPFLNINLKLEQIDKYQKFFNKLTDSLVDVLFLEGYADNTIPSYESLKNLLYSENVFPKFAYKYNLSYFLLPKFKTYQEEEIVSILERISYIRATILEHIRANI